MATVPEEFNDSALDRIGPLEGEGGMNALNEMKELGKAEEQIIWEGYRRPVDCKQIIAMDHRFCERPVVMTHW